MRISERAVLGTYRLVERLGAGGMGEVWIGEHTRLGRRAAVKVLHDSFARQPEIVNRFFNEARAATAIADPGIVQVFDFGTTEDGVAYLVMELLFGESLEQRLRGAPLAIASALRLLRQVASSLGAAHRAGIVHRDIKPDNIFIVPDPEVIGGERTKLLDFGIAKLGGTDAVRTQTSAVMGTPLFMSPEQWRGAGAVDARADIYSLGCVLFLVLAGRPPFIGDGPGELISMHVRDVAPRLSTCVPGVPTALDELVAACLAKDPAHRPQNGAVLAARLDAVFAYISTPTVGAQLTPFGATTTLSSAAAVRAPTTQRRGPMLVLAGFAVVGTMFALGTWQLRNRASDPPAAAAAPPPAPDAAVATDAAPHIDAPTPDAAVAIDAAAPVHAARKATSGRRGRGPTDTDDDGEFDRRLEMHRARATSDRAAPVP